MLPCCLVAAIAIVGLKIKLHYCASYVGAGLLRHVFLQPNTSGLACLCSTDESSDDLAVGV